MSKEFEVILTNKVTEVKFMRSRIGVIRWIMISIMLCGFMGTVTAQDVPTEVPTDVNPANVTDAQLENAVEKAQQQGYTPQQIETLARARGYSETEIANLRSRILQLQSEKGTSALDEATLRQEFGDEFDVEGELRKAGSLTSEIQGRIFGASLFNNSGLTFAPNLNIPTPDDYRLGPGDELIIDIWGASERTYQLLVGPEGSVKIPNIGPVYVNGLQVKDASAKLLARLTKIYEGLNDTSYGDKNTYGQISLGRIRSIKVNLIGEVRQPGTYTISSLSTLMHALYQSGGPSADGSFRNIEVYRQGKKVAAFDLYDYLLYGKMAGNIALEDQDIIRVPFYTSRVEIRGEVKNPALYELKEGENLQTVINYAGGFTDEAYTRLLSITRRTDQARKLITIKSEQFERFQLESGDDIQVAAIMGYFENRVSIDGAVRRPGYYELTDSLSLFELIQKAEGLAPDAFMARGQVLRFNQNLTRRNIEFSVSEVMGGAFDLLLQPEDQVTIKSAFALKGDPDVSVQGEVRNPASFTYRDSLTVEDVIFMAGGFTDAAAKSFVEVARRTTEENSQDFMTTAITFQFPIDETLQLKPRDAQFLLQPFDVVVIRQSPYFNNRDVVQVSGQVTYAGRYVIRSKSERVSDVLERAGGATSLAYLKGARLIRNGGEIAGVNFEELIRNPGTEPDVFLQDGDQIVIPKIVQTVNITGEVFEPSIVIFNSDDSFKEVIAQAGGFTDNARKGKIFVSYPNGRKARTRNFLWLRDYPRVEPGARVVVPQKAQRTHKVSVQEVFGYTSSLLTILLIVDRLR